MCTAMSNLMKKVKAVKGNVFFSYSVALSSVNPAMSSFQPNCLCFDML